MENHDVFVNYSVLAGILVGASVLVLMYILKLFHADVKNVEQTKYEKIEQSEKRKEPSQKTKKKTADNRWIARTDKQGFSHPWLLTTLKAHSGQVLDMDFSANGKYLASCAEEDAGPGGGAPDGRRSTSSSSSSGSSCEGNKENTSPSSSSGSPSPRAGKGLSRRQRKNRRREDALVKKCKPPRRSADTFEVPLRHWEKLKLSENAAYKLLRSYTLSREQMLTMGYPLDSNEYKGKTIVFKSGPVHHNGHGALKEADVSPKVDVRSSKFDVNAREFYPKSYVDSGHESGQSSGNSSDSGEVDASDVSRTFPPEFQVRVFTREGVMDLRCARCNADFRVTETGYITQDRCLYHYGKLRSTFAHLDGRTVVDTVYECCGSLRGAAGCSYAKLHIWSGVDVGFNGPFDFVRTKSRKLPPADGYHGAYALDCEMVYTVSGMECARVTVVGIDGRLVYDVFVKPEHEVVDYNTRFSGITARDLRNATKTLKDVQNDLMGFVSADTILIGHSLENDLRVLRMVHRTVIDTAVAFPHYHGLPYRRSLKSLASIFLRREIQVASNGHDSVEDSRACMDLMLWRVRKDFIGLLEHCQ